MPAGALFTTVKLNVTGLVLTGRDADLTWRVALISSSTRRADGQALPVSYTRVDIGPGLDY